MKNTLTVVQILISVLLIGSIIIQARGTGLGAAWGGGGESYHSKKGVEKIVFIASIVLATLFLLTSIANILV